jgi:primosomal protein N' (replication factor Y)
MTLAPPSPARDAAHVEVAVPVPLRRTFTYRVPPALQGALEEGSRVAVPFGPRKLAAFVVAAAPPPPPGQRTKDIAGLLDTQPVFTRELLAFLKRAAEYYLHPLGEVLRAAAPALPSEAMTALRAGGFLGERESLPGTRIATRRVLVVRAVSPMPDPGRLGKSQQLLLQLLTDRGEITLDELRRHVRSARAVVRAMEQKGLATTLEREVAADRFFAEPAQLTSGPEPNPDQTRAIAALIAQLGLGGGFLLRGITGSGKTEVYLRVIAEARARGQGALMLVPEIALTPQLVGRFRARFGDTIAVLHSELSERERNDAWRALRQGRLDLAIGARSALFAPVQNLGVIVVDEEHDGSFKQEDGFRYHARDMALLRAHRVSAVCVLGSATPSLESHFLAEQKKLTLLELPTRATSQSLPPVEIVDLARHRGSPSGQRLLSAPLHHGIEQRLAAGEQSILFLNRRGFAPSVRCMACGELLQCPACSVALTMHRGARVLRCHYCDFTTPYTNACFLCGSVHLIELGVGTEQLEQALADAFKGARVARLDRDTASGEGVEAVLERLRTRQVDILVGTQMVTKGHDLPGVTLVGVVLADQSLAFPDFRAAERTFQLLVQVAGRAGRGDRPGQVILQTYQPEHPAIVCAKQHDYLGFCRSELEARSEHGFPPFGRMVAVRIDAGQREQAEHAADVLAKFVAGLPELRSEQVQLLGPAPAPIERLRARYRQRFLLKSAQRAALRAVAIALCNRIDEGVSPARVSLDIDPVAML